MYIGAALYQICARLINCTAFNVLMHASSKKDVHFFISNSRHDINITLHSGPVCNSPTCNSSIPHASQDTAVFTNSKLLLQLQSVATIFLRKLTFVSLWNLHCVNTAVTWRLLCKLLECFLVGFFFQSNICYFTFNRTQRQQHNSNQQRQLGQHPTRQEYEQWRKQNLLNFEE